MNRFSKLMDRFRGLTYAIVRYPLTAAFLFAAAFIIAVSINTEQNYSKLLLTCAVGTALSASLQAAYERFFNKLSARFILMLIGLVLTFGYYMIIRQAPELSMEIGIRTMVALLAVVFAFILIPSIKSKVTFNESFMVVFKSFFHSAFYSIVIFSGMSLIFTSINLLITQVNNKAYPHTANIVFVIFAPLFFLSLIPLYPKGREKESDSEENKELKEKVDRAAYCPKFLEVLISYIIIPLATVFTVILLLYIFINIRGEFWTNNLLEPMLVSYAFAVILIYILSSSLDNRFAYLFRLIFPKVLIPIVLFQIASSVLSLRDTGITHGRYYVILFGIFAVCSGVIMSFMPVRKNGIIAVLLIAFSLVSIVPPVDAFTVSRISQENMLKNVLLQNGMLKDNTITPNASISDAAKKKIIKAVNYLDMMKYTDKIPYLPKNFVIYKDFNNTFGFSEYDYPVKPNRAVGVFLKQGEPMNISGYDFFTHTSISRDDNMESKICDIEKQGKVYTLTKEKTGGKNYISLRDSSKQEIIRIDIEEVLSRYRSYSTEKSEISQQEATFTAETDKARLALIVQNLNMEESNQLFYFIDCFILAEIK